MTCTLCVTTVGTVLSVVSDYNDETYCIWCTNCINFVEVYASFAPGTGGFIVAIADDTANDGNQGGQNPDASVTNNPFTAAEAAVKAAIGADTSVTITTVAVAATGISIS